MLASVILPRPANERKTELNFPVSDSNIGSYCTYANCRATVKQRSHSGKQVIVVIQGCFCKNKKHLLVAEMREPVAIRHTRQSQVIAIVRANVTI
jgi:hypothetical protein